MTTKTFPFIVLYKYSFDNRCRDFLLRAAGIAVGVGGIGDDDDAGIVIGIGLGVGIVTGIGLGVGIVIGIALASIATVGLHEHRRLLLGLRDRALLQQQRLIRHELVLLRVAELLHSLARLEVLHLVAHLQQALAECALGSVVAAVHAHVMPESCNQR